MQILAKTLVDALWFIDSVGEGESDISGSALDMFECLREDLQHCSAEEQSALKIAANEA